LFVFLCFPPTDDLIELSYYQYIQLSSENSQIVGLWRQRLLSMRRIGRELKTMSEKPTPLNTPKSQEKKYVGFVKRKKNPGRRKSSIDG